MKQSILKNKSVFNFISTLIEDGSIDKFNYKCDDSGWQTIEFKLNDNSDLNFRLASWYVNNETKEPVYHLHTNLSKECLAGYRNSGDWKTEYQVDIHGLKINIQEKLFNNKDDFGRMFEENPKFDIINESELGLKHIKWLYDLAKENKILIYDDCNKWHESEE